MNYHIWCVFTVVFTVVFTACSLRIHCAFTVDSLGQGPQTHTHKRTAAASAGGVRRAAGNGHVK